MVNMKSILTILAFGVLIVISYKPRKIEPERVEIKHTYYKLSKMDAG